MSAPEDVIREALRKWQTFSGAYGLGSEFSNDAALAALTQLVEERDRAFEDGQRSALRREARSLRDEDYEQLVVDLREARARAEAAEAALRVLRWWFEHDEAALHEDDPDPEVDDFGYIDVRIDREQATILRAALRTEDTDEADH